MLLLARTLENHLLLAVDVINLTDWSITSNKLTKNDRIAMILGLLESVKRGLSFHRMLCGVI